MRKVKPYLYVPSLVFLGVFTYFPILYSTYLSFFRQNVFTLEPVFDWFGNYIAVFEEPVFKIVVRNTIVYALGTIPITMFLALLMAILLNENLGWIRDLYRVACFYPTMIPMAAAGMLAVWLLTPALASLTTTSRCLGYQPLNGCTT